MKLHFKLKTLIITGLVILTFCLFILFAPSIWLVEKLTNKSNYFWLFLGLGQLVLLIGLILFAFYSVQLWYLCYTLSQKQEEKKADCEEKYQLQKKQNEDAEKRRQLEHERNRINDFFRLIELAKEKPEETNEKTKTKEKGEAPKNIDNDKTTKKNEGVNTETLANFMEHYNNLTTKQLNT